jgi:hypothetical protein
MANQTRQTTSARASKDLHRLTVRIALALEKRLQAYSLVTDRTYNDLVETAIEKYLSSLKLTNEQRRKVQVLVGD